MINFYKYHFTKSETKSIDRAMMLVATIHPLAAIPQVIDIYSNKSATNVSLATWLAFMLIGLIFLLYAIAHRLTPMIINQILWFAMDFAIVAGVLLYG